MDHKRISVAQLGEAEKLALSKEPRPILNRINYAAEESEVSVTITLDFEGESYSASVTGPNTRQHRLRLTAKATLDVIGNVFAVDSRLALIDVQKIIIAEHEALVALVSLYLEQKEETLLGIALNKGDDLEAAARAALDSVNRKVAIMRKG